MADAELKVLVANRGHLKGVITRTYNFCTSETINNAPKEALQERLLRLRQVFADYDRITQEISTLDPDDSEDIESMESKFYDSIAVLKGLTSATYDISSQPKQGQSIKLPKIHIPTFDGKNIIDYYPFINMFNAAVDSNSELGECQKFYHLKSFLTGRLLN